MRWCTGLRSRLSYFSITKAGGYMVGPVDQQTSQRDFLGLGDTELRLTSAGLTASLYRAKRRCVLAGNPSRIRGTNDSRTARAACGADR